MRRTTVMTRTLAATLCLVAGLGLAACGSSDDAMSDETMMSDDATSEETMMGHDAMDDETAMSDGK
ncbi:hypothetical protein [Actinomyces sp. ZJ751]|uniref:hypothetical protein n=1 Tax=Actinomyces sp. ZJ751 TaxID=2708341 RepID=UPI001421BDA3|nr:hypothetical protein [Actinomyces sp. ZJ751]